MIKQIKNSQPKDMLRIEYMPGNICNYKCHYCFPGSNEGNYRWPDIDIVKSNLSHLLSHYKSQGKTKSNIYLVGGEVTVWKHLPELCEHLKSNFDTIIEISTNGTKSVKWWDTYGDLFDHISVSVHREFADINHLIDICDLLYKKDLVINADVMMDPDAFDLCIDIIEQLKNSKYDWPIVAKVLHFDGVHRYTQDQLQFFENKRKRFPGEEWYYARTKKPGTEVTIIKDNGEEIFTTDDSWIIRNNLNYFKDWSCNLGLDFIKILPNGRITGNCGQSLYNDYNLYDTRFKEIFNPVIGPVVCSRSICRCNEETVCTKRKLDA